MQHTTIILLLSCLASLASTAHAQGVTSYSGTVVISGESVPLVLRGGAATGDGANRYLFAGQASSPAKFPGDNTRVHVTANLFEHESTAKLLLFVTPPMALGPLYAGRYETTPPLTGSLSMSLVAGYGVWSPVMPATISLTPGP